jgi:hypothetical protein
MSVLACDEHDRVIVATRCDDIGRLGLVILWRAGADDTVVGAGYVGACTPQDGTAIYHPFALLTIPTFRWTNLCCHVSRNVARGQV